ncbi:hypothetical protein Nmel_017699, partial [Mimus melanotis]
HLRCPLRSRPGGLTGNGPPRAGRAPPPCPPHSLPPPGPPPCPPPLRAPFPASRTLHPLRSQLHLPGPFCGSSSRCALFPI